MGFIDELAQPHPSPSHQRQAVPSAPLEARVEDKKRYKLTLRRSAWFDLLDPTDRVDLFRGVWAVVAWQMREM